MVLILEFLYSREWIHRDIKASHVFIDSELRVTLIDFGFSKKLSQNERTSSICGTYHAMAPEILKMLISDPLENITYSHAVDLYSLGVLTYELLHG